MEPLVVSALSSDRAAAASDRAVVRPGRVNVWIQAVRIFSFTASIVPIVVGSALALVERSFDLLLFAVMLAASVACHAGANMANDYFDHRKGIDTDDTLGPSKVIQLGYLRPADVLRGTFIAFAAATALGLYIVSRTGWPILILALLSLGAAVLYTGGPRPLGYVALGELVVFVFMGPVMVCGAYYVHIGDISLQSALLSLPIGSLVAAILHANNIRDADGDAAAGKRTLANVFGRRLAHLEYAALLLGAYATTVILIAVNPDLWMLLVTFASLPVAMALIRTVRGHSGPAELNRVLRKTAGLHLRFGLLATGALLARTLADRAFS